jgi:hypothetical protein
MVRRQCYPAADFRPLLALATVSGAEAKVRTRIATIISQPEIAVMSSRCMSPTHGPSACTNSSDSAAPASREDPHNKRPPSHVAGERPGQNEHADDDTEVAKQRGQAVDPAHRRLRRDIGWAVDSVGRHDGDSQGTNAIDPNEQ